LRSGGTGGKNVGGGGGGTPMYPLCTYIYGQCVREVKIVEKENLPFYLYRCRTIHFSRAAEFLESFSAHFRNNNARPGYVYVVDNCHSFLFLRHYAECFQHFLGLDKKANFLAKSGGGPTAVCKMIVIPCGFRPHSTVCHCHIDVYPLHLAI
jgi:hypothetical protein